MNDTAPDLASQLLDCIVCPLTRSKLTMQDNYLVSEIGGLKYPIVDGVPVLIADEAILPEGYATLDAFKQAFKDHVAN
ncbi:MAG: hypothetical protein JKX85_08105 [Phycisphaeraceae bacterium]|nr:hypothetical protein [Phycisphaeraceae bacterium]